MSKLFERKCIARLNTTIKSLNSKLSNANATIEEQDGVLRAYHDGEVEARRNVHELNELRELVREQYECIKDQDTTIGYLRCRRQYLERFLAERYTVLLAEIKKSQSLQQDVLRLEGELTRCQRDMSDIPF